MTVALAVNGSVGTAAVVICQIVLPAFTANERVPGRAERLRRRRRVVARVVAVPMQSFGPAARPHPRPA